MTARCHNPIWLNTI